MRFTPRRGEVASIVEILESDAYDGAEAMAKDIIKEVVDILSYRDTYAGTLRLRDGDHGINLGPFYSEADIKSYLKSIATGGEFGAVKVFAPGPIKANQQGADDRSPWCLTEGCGHPAYAHLTDGSSRGKCGLSDCECSRYKK